VLPRVKESQNGEREHVKRGQNETTNVRHVRSRKSKKKSMISSSRKERG